MLHTLLNCMFVCDIYIYIYTSPPKVINNTSIASNSSNSFSKLGDFETFDTQDRELLDILEELANVEKAIKNTMLM